MIKVSRQSARHQGFQYYYTGEPCRHGHDSERYVKSGQCVTCARERIKQRRANDPEREKERERQYAIKRKAKKRKYDKRRYQETRAAAIERARNYYDKNREKALNACRQWRKLNSDRKSANNAKYRAAKRNATPQWLTDEDLLAIQAIYCLAKEAGKMTSVAGLESETFHVDHIVPLSSDKVCGLHVPWNLQILPASDNISKSNQLCELH